MIHPCTRLAFISEDVGHGVVATNLLPRGTITWVQDPLDRVFPPESFQRLPARTQEILEYFAFRNGEGDWVLCWDHGRYVNHSFRSNCLSTGYGFEIAVRDIHPGEELTDDYGYLNLTTPWRPKDEGTRRKWVRPDDARRYAPSWDRLVLQALRSMVEVDQPLLEWLPKRLTRELDQVVRGEAPMRSVAQLFWDPSCNGANGR